MDPGVTGKSLPPCLPGAQRPGAVFCRQTRKGHCDSSSLLDLFQGTVLWLEWPYFLPLQPSGPPCSQKGTSLQGLFPLSSYCIYISGSALSHGDMTSSPDDVVRGFLPAMSGSNMQCVCVSECTCGVGWGGHECLRCKNPQNIVKQVTMGFSLIGPWPLARGWPPSRETGIGTGNAPFTEQSTSNYFFGPLYKESSPLQVCVPSSSPGSGPGG